ncbi:MerR family transcriptional regulator [Peribacillus glennii]|uniref:MerR family transcriptional regulator n=1 Tax=Peribacillus glennii TaxID=2303991 RepID=A0A372LH28_9BACI|nr:MerR family transcriptional regulator [Peribacillus glennii]RFU65294.1 MerR family transcriptional regulator [Peribacillus glennii]
MTNNQIQRAYSIKDVSKKISIPTGTIRQWEKDLQGLLYIPRSKQGARFYTEKEITLLEKVKEMRANNLSKDMIRMLLDKHLNEGSQAPSETSKTSAPGDEDKSIVPVQNAVPSVQTPNIDELYAAMENYKQHMLSEIKNVIQTSQTEMMEDVKKEISQGTLQTVQSLSKSIQRSNEKREAEAEEIAQTITKASEHTSKTFGTLSKDIAKASETTSLTIEALSEYIAQSSEDTYDKIAKRLTDSSRTTSKDYKILANKVAQDVKAAQADIRTVSKSLHEDQELFVDAMNQNLKELTQVIRDREEAFQDMVSSFREVAAAKKEKKWWKVFSW